MDPITIGVVVVVGALLFMRSSPAASAQGGAPIAGSTGATMTMKGRPVAGDGTPPPTDTSPNRWPPPPPNPSDVAQVMFYGARSVADGARSKMADTLNNLTATAKQRATGLTGGLDPAFVDAGSAKAAVAFMQRGLTTIDSSIYNAFGSTQTGAAIQRKAARTGAEIIAAGGSAADAAAQAARNAADAAAQAARNADASAANFIDNGIPAPPPPPPPPSIKKLW